MSVARTTLNGVGCINPLQYVESSPKILSALRATGLKFNGFEFKGGSEPGYAHLLLLQRDLTTAVTESITNTIVITDGLTTVTANNLLFVKSRNLFPRSNENGLVIATFADTRFLSNNWKESDTTDPFPVHDFINTEGDTFESTWADAIDDYWDKSNIQFASGSLVDANASYPTNLIKDVNTAFGDSYWETLNQIMDAIAHRIYKTASGFEIIHHGYTNSVNTAKATAFTNNLIAKTNNLSADYVRIPESIDVKFPKISSNQLDDYHTINRTYSTYGGSSNTISGTKKEVYLWNLYDPNDPDASTHLTYITSLANDVADLHFEAYDNHKLNDAVYFGVIDFSPGPDCDLISYYQDLNTFAYQTLVRSIDTNVVLLQKNVCRGISPQARLAVANGSITAASYTSNVYTLGTGTVDLVFINSNDELEYYDNSKSVTAKNWAEEAIDDGQLLLVEPMFDGNWLITNATCDGSTLATLDVT